MVYTVILKWLGFKQDLGNIATMMADEKATYAILRYATDIPQVVYAECMDQLIEVLDALEYRKLINLVKEFKSVSSISMTMDEEHIETLFLTVDPITGMMEIKSEENEDAPVFMGQPINLSVDEEDDDDEEEITIIRIDR